MEIIVIGGGIIGLTTALELQRKNHVVHIWAEKFSPATTSDVAAALWYPYLVQPEDKVAIWSQIAYEHFRADTAFPERGVRWRKSAFEMTPHHLSEDDLPLWRFGVDGFRRADAHEIPLGYQDGYAFDAPVIATSTYLPYLLGEFTAQGGQIQQRTIQHFDEAFAHASVVVNCAGLGARELVPDAEMHAVRGQVVRIRMRQGARTMSADDGPQGLVYVIPRIDDIVLGGVNSAGDERQQIDDSQTQSILERVQQFAPELGKIDTTDITGIASGLRPARKSGVRVASEQRTSGQWLLHNYGHGGAGVTLSWGCAAAITEMVENNIRTTNV